MNKNDDVTAHSPHDNGDDVIMDETDANNSNDGSASTIQPNCSNDDDDDIEMSPRKDEAVNPMENTTAMKNDDLESSFSSAPLEQSAIPASIPTTKNDDGEENSPEEVSLDDGLKEECPTDEEKNRAKQDAPPPSAEQRRRDDNHLDDTLGKLQHSISVAILTFRKDEQGDEAKNDNDGGSSAYVKLCEAAMEAYQTLVEYGASLDLSLDMISSANKRRREKLEKIGR